MTDEYRQIAADVVPDLASMPRRAWKDALRPLHPASRTRAIARLGDTGEGREAANAVLVEVTLEDFAVPAPRPAPLVPKGDAAPFSVVRSRQLNMRLSLDEHRRLAEAANRFGLRPTALARQLVVRGIRQLQDED